MVGQKNYQKVLVLIMLAFVVFANSKFEIEYPNGYMPNCVKDNETAEIHDFLQEQGINRIMVTDSLGNRLRSEDTDISVVFGEDPTIFLPSSLISKRFRKFRTITKEASSKSSYEGYFDHWWLQYRLRCCFSPYADSE